MNSTPTEGLGGGFLDRLALWFEGGGRGTATTYLLDLSKVLDPEELSSLSEPVRRFYAEPLGFRVRVGVDMSRWSRFLMRIFGVLIRQSRLADRGPGFEGYRVRQFLYLDRRRRVHWDRYVWDGVGWERLFLARFSGEGGFVRETFVVYGLPVTLCFKATVEEGALVLTLRWRGSSVLTWPARVRYRTAVTPNGLQTRGDFRIPILGLVVETEFRATAMGPSRQD